jgi:hypothetical protein
MNDTLTECAEKWLSQYSQLADEGAGDDLEYSRWYRQMLETTAPTGLIAAYRYWDQELPKYMYVSCGPDGCDRFDLPPPGTADAP